nr:hypothetical protein BHM03_00053736 [Ipomoea batatas]
MPSSSSISDSEKPFLAVGAELSGESLTLETRAHWMRAKAMPMRAQTGIRISVPRSGRIVTPLVTVISGGRGAEHRRRKWA